MIKYSCIHSKQKIYVDTIVSMPPVMGVRKTLSNIPGKRKHIWLKVFSNKPMEECISENLRYLRLITKKLSLLKIEKFTIVPMPPNEG